MLERFQNMTGKQMAIGAFLIVVVVALVVGFWPSDEPEPEATPTVEAHE